MKCCRLTSSYLVLLDTGVVYAIQNCLLFDGVAQGAFLAQGNDCVLHLKSDRKERKS